MPNRKTSETLPSGREIWNLTATLKRTASLRLVSDLKDNMNANLPSDAHILEVDDAPAIAPKD